MAVIAKVKTKTKSKTKPARSKSTSSTPRTIPSRPGARVEAPDRGHLNREAPEGRGVEAPDAGEGRMSHFESEFTHGRSQS